MQILMRITSRIEENTWKWRRQAAKKKWALVWYSSCQEESCRWAKYPEYHRPPLILPILIIFCLIWFGLVDGYFSPENRALCLCNLLYKYNWLFNRYAGRIYMDSLIDNAFHFSMKKKVLQIFLGFETINRLKKKGGPELKSGCKLLVGINHVIFF